MHKCVSSLKSTACGGEDYSPPQKTLRNVIFLYPCTFQRHQSNVASEFFQLSVGNRNPAATWAPKNTQQTSYSIPQKFLALLHDSHILLPTWKKASAIDHSKKNPAIYTGPQGKKSVFIYKNYFAFTFHVRDSHYCSF